MRFVHALYSHHDIGIIYTSLSAKYLQSKNINFFKNIKERHERHTWAIVRVISRWSGAVGVWRQWPVGRYLYFVLNLSEFIGAVTIHEGLGDWPHREVDQKVGGLWQLVYTGVCKKHNTHVKSATDC